MKYYVVDAFTSEHFCGNPAGVCLIDKWLEPEIMQKIAAENRLSETAFVKPRADGSFDIRWFTPGAEVNLCGHATLASSYILGRFIEPEQQTFVLHSHMSGDLTAIRLPDGRYELDFPAWEPKPVEITPSICEALGFEPKGVWLTRDLVVQAEHEEIIRNFQPDLQAICNLEGLGLLLTAKGSKSDFVCRTFFPKIAVDEDPVCGSAVTENWRCVLQNGKKSCKDQWACMPIHVRRNSNIITIRIRLGKQNRTGFFYQIKIFSVLYT